ncbi:MAG: SDR family NAD(P)-dependent oxidoreductase, partial [Gammaproteobacteria bacterium]|nr:SDR family NAD(P)-dependent oxidoreductase [Gammaproteobacteria bacterium]
MSSTVLVTGSSRGIGKAIAMRLANDSYDLVLHCRSNRKQTDTLLSQIIDLGREARVLQFDIADRKQCREILEADIERYG